jgi:calcineurin-like phosphoesterase family protein
VADSTLIYVSADWHWGHAKLLEYESRPRGYEEMLIERHAKVLTDETDWYCLGDLALCRADERKRCAAALKSLPGRKHFIRGNHDGFSRRWLVEDCGFETVERYALIGDVFLSHFPLVHIYDRYLDSQREIQRAFDNSGARWNVHGHTHSRRSPDPRCICVSVEQTDYGPVSLASLIARTSQPESAPSPSATASRRA